MCGICGFYDRDPESPRDEGELVAMGETIRHRGPDSHGSTLHRGVGLHNRRLKIIDLEGGDQPIFTEDGQVAVVFNGEIFNFQDLRRRLERKGHRFRTNCDTEVLVHLYREHGARRMLPYLNGFFAFALHDRQKGRLVLARDRVGVKPLYYAETDRGLVFGSELKPLLREGSVRTDLDPSALMDFLCLRYIPAPKTIFAGARKLPAGHLLLYDGKTAQVEPWWDLPEFGTRHARPEELAEELWELVKDSVKLRLLSDVPLGAFLSGGLDSSAVVTAMQQWQGSDVHAVSVGFAGWDQSELHHAQRIAQGLDIQLITAVLEPDVLQTVDELGEFFDEPFADPSAIPTYHLARRTRQEVTVALSGDGGDECFAGYRRYRFDGLEQRVRSLLPGPVFRALFAGLGRVYPQSSHLPRVLRARTTLQNLGRSPLEAYVRSVSCRSHEEARALLHPDLRREVGDYHPAEMFRPWFEHAPVHDSLSRSLYVDFHTWLPEYILCKSDRATMAWSLEAREPLLDHRLVEFAARLPADLKLRRGTGKWLWKMALASHLPPATIDRPKQGFAPPLKQWIDQDLSNRVGERKAPEWIDPQALADHTRRHRAGGRDHSELLYQMLVLESFERRLPGWRAASRGGN